MPYPLKGSKTECANPIAGFNGEHGRRARSDLLERVLSDG